MSRISRMVRGENGRTLCLDFSYDYKFQFALALISHYPPGCPLPGLNMKIQIRHLVLGVTTHLVKKSLDHVVRFVVTVPV
ncbi:hypothetical protein VKT23_015290 [Stygiomarasmius scandens]|uniref:Uncharacterized protein n=1 Tax=Marasmiellus scandens TaxID=2682957 RepID=A0ABR1IY56_9AGAR